MDGEDETRERDEQSEGGEEWKEGGERDDVETEEQEFEDLEPDGTSFVLPDRLSYTVWMN